MNILISSNLERLIYRIAGNSEAADRELMQNLAKDGKYEITDAMKKELADFYGNYASEQETADAIAKLYSDTGYVIDTHTAVAAAVYGKYREETYDETKTVIASTAKHLLNAYLPILVTPSGTFILVSLLHSLKA